MHLEFSRCIFVYNYLFSMGKNILSEIKIEYKKQRTISEARLMSLLDRYNNNVILESSEGKKLKADIISESVKVERLTLLEAAAGLNEDELRNQYFGMVESLYYLAQGLSCGSLLNKVNDMQEKADDLLMLGSADKTSMKKFMNMMTDMSILTKGMLHLGIKLTEEGGDKLGDTVSTIKSVAGSEKSPIATVLSSLGKKTVKGGMFSRAKDEFQTKLFVDELKKAALTSSPGFLKVLGQDVFSDLAQCVISMNISSLQGVFDRYVTKTMDAVDDKFLSSMSKPGFFATIKNIGDFFSGGSATPRM